MRVFANHRDLRALQERLKVPVVMELIKADVQEQRLTEHAKLEQALEDADKEVVRLNLLLRMLARREGHKYNMTPASTRCVGRHNDRNNLKYRGGGD